VRSNGWQGSYGFINIGYVENIFFNNDFTDPNNGLSTVKIRFSAKFYFFILSGVGGFSSFLKL